LDLGDLLDINVSIAAAGGIRSLEEAPGVISVITREDIRRLGLRTLEQILELLPGIEVLTDGVGRGRIFVRGIGSGNSSQNVLVLFDGHRLNDEATGGASQINLDIVVDNIERVEIIRGPGSALFGANAFLGVINIVSQTAATFEGFEVSTLGGSFGSSQFNGLWGHRFGDLEASAFLQVNDRSGPSLLVLQDGQTLFDALVEPFGIDPVTLAPGLTAGARRSIDANLRLSFRGLTLNGRYKDEDSDGYIGTLDTLRPGSRLRNRQVTLDLTYERSFGPRVDVRARALLTENRNHEQLDILAPGFAFQLNIGGFTIVFPVEPGVLVENITKSRRIGGELLADIQLAPNNQLVLGGAYETEKPYFVETLSTLRRVEGLMIGDLEIIVLPNEGLELIDDSIPERRRNIGSFFLQDTWNIGPRVTLTAGLRFDDYSDFGSTLNPRLALVWRLPSGLNLKLLYGRAFRAPTIQELFFFTPGITGNPDLKPSVINTIEAAVVYRKGQFRLSADLFANFIRDFIVQTEPLPTPDRVLEQSFVNLDDIDSTGVEIELRRDFGFEHSVFLNYTYQNARDRATGDPVPLAPKHLLNLGFTAGIGPYLSLTSTLQVRGQRPRAVDDPRDPMNAYGVVNLNLRVLNLLRGVELAATVNNLFDARYSDPALRPLLPEDYPQAGRSGFIKLYYLF
ncbi:MAG: TonB-dependent receptor, partial [Acidobacteria bacterium]|nr:TonB-dependent receptor [Acidobacteriota bacterium]